MEVNTFALVVLVLVGLCSGESPALYDDDFVMVSFVKQDNETTEVLQISLDQDDRWMRTTRQILLPPVVNTMPEYDPIGQQIIFNNERALKSAPLTALENVTDIYYKDTGNLADYIGIDADAGLIVFAEKGVIHLSTTSGDWISNEKPVLPSHGIEFRVHRRYKQLYWLSRMHVLRTDYDGGNPDVFYRLTKLGEIFITNCVIDYSEDAMVWLEEDYRNGGNVISLKRKLFSETRGTLRSYSEVVRRDIECSHLAVTADSYVCISSDNRHILIYGKDALLKRTIKLDSSILEARQFNYVRAIMVYESDTYDLGTPTKPLCFDARCSHFCIPINSTNSYRCECPSYYKLSGDNATCTYLSTTTHTPTPTWPVSCDTISPTKPATTPPSGDTIVKSGDKHSSDLHSEKKEGVPRNIHILRSMKGEEHKK